MIIIDDDEQISPPKPSTCFHRYKGFPDVLSKNWYDWHLSIKGDLSKTLSLFPHDRVLVGTKLTLVPTTRGNSDKVTLMKKGGEMLPIALRRTGIVMNEYLFEQLGALFSI